MKLLTVQLALEETDLAPLLSEITFLCQEDCKENGAVEELLISSTSLHISVHYDLQNVA